LAAYFFDSSAIVKRYLKEAGTGWVRSLIEPRTGNLIYIAAITSVEVVAAITRRTKSGSISPDDAALAISEFRNHLFNEYFEIEVNHSVINSAMLMAESHALRGYDAVQLAAALEVNANLLSLAMPALTLVSSDNDLNAAAASETLKVENPILH